MSKIITSFYRGEIVESIHQTKCYIGSVSNEKIFFLATKEQIESSITETRKVHVPGKDGKPGFWRYYDADGNVIKEEPGDPPSPAKFKSHAFDMIKRVRRGGK